MIEVLPPKKGSPRRRVGATSPGRSVPGMREIAAIAGVSAMTVSRALKGEANIDPETRRRIVAAAERFGYVLNSNAKVFASGQSGLIAVLGGTLEEECAPETLRIWNDKLFAAGLQLLHGGFPRDPGEEERIVAALLQRRPEVAVLPGGPHTKITERRLRESRVPLIETGFEPTTPLDSFVGVSMTVAFDAAVKIVRRRRGDVVAALGRGSLGPEENMRLTGAFADAARRAKCKLWNACPTEKGGDDIERGAAAARGILTEQPAVRGVVCETFGLAHGLASGLHRLGMHAENGLCICSLGDSSLSRHGFGNLSCVPIDVAAMTREAADLAVQALASARRGKPIGPHVAVLDQPWASRTRTEMT